MLALAIEDNTASSAIVWQHPSRANITTLAPFDPDLIARYRQQMERDRTTGTIAVEAAVLRNRETGAANTKIAETIKSPVAHERPLAAIAKALVAQLVRHIEADTTADQLGVLRRSLADAIMFASNLDATIPVPHVSAAGDGEIAFQWATSKARLMISFEGDGKYGYAMLRGEAIAPGEVEVQSASDFPDDLRTYLAQIVGA